VTWHLDAARYETCLQGGLGLLAMITEGNGNFSPLHLSSQKTEAAKSSPTFVSTRDGSRSLS